MHQLVDGRCMEKGFLLSCHVNSEKIAMLCMVLSDYTRKISAGL